jgi:hypothetical protein
MIVTKFGGTSVGDAAAIARTATSCASASTASGGGDLRARGHDQSPHRDRIAGGGGQLIVALSIIEELRARHFEAIDALLGVMPWPIEITSRPARCSMSSRISPRRSRCSGMHAAIARRGGRDGRATRRTDRRRCARQAGVPAVTFVDARRVMATTADFGKRGTAH